MENFTELLLIVEYSDFRDIETDEYVLVMTENHIRYAFKVWGDDEKEYRYMRWDVHERSFTKDEMLNYLNSRWLRRLQFKMATPLVVDLI